MKLALSRTPSLRLSPPTDCRVMQMRRAIPIRATRPFKPVVRAALENQDPSSSPQEPTSPAPAIKSSPEEASPIMQAISDSDNALSTRVLFGSIFALTLLIWSMTRYFFPGPSASSAQASNEGAAAKTIRESTEKSKVRRRLKADSPKLSAASTPSPKESTSVKTVPDPPTPTSTPANLLDKKPPPIPSVPVSVPRPESPSASGSSHLGTDRDLPVLREKASSALRAAASAADASQKASSHASSSSMAAKKAGEAASRASLAASEAQLALEEAAEEAVMAAELRARQAASLASDLEQTSYRSSAAASAFDDLAQLQASIAIENAALASSLHSKRTEPQSLPIQPVSPSSLNPSTSQKQNRLAKGFGSDAVKMGGTWLREVGEGAKESIEGAWKRVSGTPSSGFKKEKGTGSTSSLADLALPPSAPPSMANKQAMVPSSNDGPTFPPN